ncbi:hypothetical protein V5799_020834 [Amblyomma americanum]|uniref:Uncharacterized protein n=1 Tax=Amblyomma americanum TaxID=6943 RepID=A0AAQ4ET66_AMBAM
MSEKAHWFVPQNQKRIDFDARQDHSVGAANAEARRRNRQATATIMKEAATMIFTDKFLDNLFGYSCSVCDRLWFENDFTAAALHQLPVLSCEFPDSDLLMFRLCASSLSSVRSDQVPHLSGTKGYQVCAQGTSPASAQQQ